MSTPLQKAEAPKRYPKRKRTAVSYKDIIESEELGEDVDHNVYLHESDQDEDWHVAKRMKQKSKAIARKSRTSSQAKKKQPFFPLMSLPPELRLEIYKLAVTHPNDVVYIEAETLTNNRSRRRLTQSWGPNGHMSHNDFKATKIFRNLRLLRASKQIYEEAAELFYKQTFAFKSATTLQTFLLLQSVETMSRLRQVEVIVRESEWNLMPGVSAQMASLVNIEKLSVLGLSHKTSGRNFVKYLSETKRPISGWEVCLESFDKLSGLKLARDTYPYLYPLFRKVVRDRGVEQLAGMLDLRVSKSQEAWWPIWRWHPWGDRTKATQFKNMAETAERRSVRYAAVGEEIVRLLEGDF